MEWKRVFHVAAIKSFSRGAHYGVARIVRYGRWIGRRRPAVHEHPEVLCRLLGPEVVHLLIDDDGMGGGGLRWRFYGQQRFFCR